MTRRSSKEISFFCQPEEIGPLLEPILERFGLLICAADKRGERWFFHGTDAEKRNAVRLPQFYLIDSITAEGSLDSLANIVQIWFPRLSGGALCMGEIGMLITPSELDEKVVKLQQQVYEEIGKTLKNQLHRGVWGRNTKTGGEHFYKDILISPEVETDARNGLVLRTTLGDGFVTFSPDRVQ